MSNTVWNSEQTREELERLHTENQKLKTLLANTEILLEEIDADILRSELLVPSPPLDACTESEIKS